MIKLRYGNTNTYFINGLLIDTDMPGTLRGLFQELKRNGLQLSDVRYVLATHYHPDHMGLIGELTALGVRHLVLDKQQPYLHFADPIFARQKGLPYQPIHDELATVISCDESRQFLAALGLAGEIVSTQSHSADGVALLTDAGSCFVGDLEPPDFIEAYADNTALRQDWTAIFRLRPHTACFAHRPEQKISAFL